jgi:amidase
MSELWQLGALELVEKIRQQEASSREVLESHLARVDDVNPHLNAIVRRLDDEALAAADAADHAVANGDVLGPLHGVPISVKENIDVAGTPTTQGVPLFAGAVASIDAPMVERMRLAGAIPFARTNMPDLGLRVHTRSSLHGLTLNPWNPLVTAGGSSGGEGSAIASGMSPLGLGNDIGGSLRNPAHCCGIASIKPTSGVVPTATVVPPLDDSLASQQMHASGPMARRVSDVRAGLMAMAGWSHRDPRSVSAQLTDLNPGELTTIAVMANPPDGETHPEIAAAVIRAGDALADAGHNVVEATPPDCASIGLMWAALLIADINVNRALIDAVVAPEASRIIDLLIKASPTPTIESAVQLQYGRYKAMREWSEFFQLYPVLLSPTWSLPAFEHDADALGAENETQMHDTLRNVLPGNLLGIPGAVVPCGMAAGLPVGVQIMGDKFTDLRCLAIAEQIENAVGVLTPIDPVTAA